MRIAVCGDGPIAHSIAAVCGSRGHAVRVLVDQPRRWSNCLDAELPDGTSVTAPLDCVTHDSARALNGVDVAMICVPHRDLERMTRRVARLASSSMLVGAVPGFGGFGLCARAILGARVTFFGTQRIPFVVRAHTPGRRVIIGGVRRQTFVATSPAQSARTAAEVLSHLLGVPTVPISHYINVELSPSNSIVNPARLYALFGSCSTRGPRPREGFFSGWNLAASRILMALDHELQQGRRLIPRDTSFVAPILLQYDANDPSTLTDRIRRLRALAGRPVPIRLGRATARVDARSDYVREDIDRGLAIIRDILRLAGAHTPLMDDIIAWRQTLDRSSGRMVRLLSKPTRYERIEDLLAQMD